VPHHLLFAVLSNESIEMRFHRGLIAMPLLKLARRDVHAHHLLPVARPLPA